MTATKTQSTKKNDFVHNPLPVLYSARVRLNPEQREQLREAHQSFRRGFQQQAPKPVLSGSTVSVETQFAPPADKYQAFGLSDIVVSDLIGTRDSIALNTILQLQRLLGVEIITKKELVSRFNDYLQYLEVV